MTLRYAHEPKPAIEAIRALYAAAPLRRPIGDVARIKVMFEESNVVISAYDGDKLVGVLRGWTDGVYDGYICDLAIHPAYQKQGVGKQLMEEAFSLGEGIQWVLLASPLAKDYYAHVGWKALTNGWCMSRQGGEMPSYEAFQAQFAELAAKA